MVASNIDWKIAGDKIMECLIFGAFVVAVTALWVYILRDRPFTFLTYAMFFPGATALCWMLCKGSLLQFIYDISGITQVHLAYINKKEK